MLGRLERVFFRGVELNHQPENLWFPIKVVPKKTIDCSHHHIPALSLSIKVSRENQQESTVFFSGKMSHPMVVSMSKLSIRDTLW